MCTKYTQHTQKCTSAQTQSLMKCFYSIMYFQTLFLICFKYHLNTTRQYWKIRDILDSSTSSILRPILFLCGRIKTFCQNHFPPKNYTYVFSFFYVLEFVLGVVLGWGMTKCNATIINRQCYKTDVFHLCNVTLPRSNTPHFHMWDFIDTTVN